MNALNEKLPEIISDEQGYKKAKRELDKTVFDLDQADRLEKQGYTKEAIAEREKAADRGANLWHYMTQYQSSANTAAAHERSSKYTADTHLEGQKLTAAAMAGSKGQADADRIQRSFISASVELGNVNQAIAAEKKAPDYLAAKKLLAFEPKGKQTKVVADQRKEARELVAEREKKCASNDGARQAIQARSSAK
jgi:hypothetical protein